MNTDTDIEDFDDLLDITLDDLEDLPEFKNYPPGAHKVAASFEAKKINDVSSIELKFKYLELVELPEDADPETAPKPGDEANTMFMMDNEYARGNFKRLSKPFAEKFGYTTAREIIEECQDIECVIITGIRVNKKDKDNVKEYMDVKELVIL